MILLFIMKIGVISKMIDDEIAIDDDVHEI